MSLQTRSVARPRLENGDHLTRVEFERRYSAAPGLKKAELIEGVVYVPSPVRAYHAEPHGMMAIWLGTYGVMTGGSKMLIEPSVRLDLDNEPQPDLLLRAIDEGSSWIGGDGYVEGAPELVVEIAASSVSIDLNQKLNVYRRNGVQEYLVWRVEESQIDWFELQGGEYRSLVADPEGIIRSRVFPGLWLQTEAVLKEDMSTVLMTLQQGIRTVEGSGPG